MFLEFQNDDNKQIYGGSDFIEIQYCRLPIGTPEKEIVSVNSVTHRKKDSLYVTDENAFYKEYKEILGNGLYNNMKHGALDACGINYYRPESTDNIIINLKKYKPSEYEVFLRWLTDSSYLNGFYILGV